MSIGSRLEKVNRDTLTPIVSSAVGSSDATITEWDCHLGKGDWTSSGRLVCRISGRAKRGNEELSWSVYLKVPNPTGTHLDAWHREPFQREVLLYRSGLLEDLPGGLAAPHCLGIMEHPDDEPWIWLEDVAGKPALEWPVERFTLTAYQLGFMQGAFLAGRPLPEYQWLDTADWLRQGVASTAGRVPSILERFARHPMAGRLYDSGLGERLQDLWAEREVFLHALERMPKSLCHGDFNYTNLISRPGPDGTEQTVAVDWQYAGLRQIGGDIAGLIADSSICPVRRKAAEPEEFTEPILESYLSGMRDSGWQVDPRVARLACLATLAWPWSFNLLLGLDGGVLSHTPEAENRHHLERNLDEYARRQEFLFGLAEESRSLLRVVEGDLETQDR